MTKGKEGYLLVWDDSLIFPDLLPSDKVRVSTTEADRGTIYDRNGTVLAGEGFAITVGIVPGKLKEKETAVSQIASFLEMDVSSVEKKLSAQWVKEDSFVPIKMIPKVNEREVMSLEPDEKVKKEKERQDKLLEIPGVMFLPGVIIMLRPYIPMNRSIWKMR